MTALAEHQFEIVPGVDAMDGVVWGIGSEVSIDEDGFQPSGADWITQDVSNDRRGVLGFGRDVKGPQTWAWASHVNKADVKGALSALSALSAAWSPDLRAPGAQVAVRYRVGGRDRRIIGRPRRFVAPPTNLILNGYVAVDHDFQAVDAYTYDDLESSAQILYSSSASGGGFVLPSSWPLSGLPSNGNGSEQIQVGGDAPTYPVIRFVGPWTNPSIDTGDWRLSWTGSIGPTGWVEIDCRPWALTVLNQSGGSAVSGLPRTTFLEDCVFQPGTSPQISLGGIAPSGGAAAIVRWRNAWTSY